MKKVLFGGAFDLFHCGHLMAIREAKKLGYLIVNVNSDERVRVKKGDSRPIIPAEERIEIVGSVKEVDEVVYYDDGAEYDIGKLLDRVKPDILVVNNDGAWPGDQDECDRRGVELVRLDRCVPRSGLDTTKIIKKIVDAHSV